MSVAQLDAVFPYICFAYGAMVTIVLQSPQLSRIADQRMPREWLANFRSHRVLALVCLYVGAAWILQNLWLA